MHGGRLITTIRSDPYDLSPYMYKAPAIQTCSNRTLLAGAYPVFEEGGNA